MSVGICPICRTNLDPEEVIYCDAQGWYEAYCVECGKYVRKLRPPGHVREGEET